jgi:hypothetical protein
MWLRYRGLSIPNALEPIPRSQWDDNGQMATLTQRAPPLFVIWDSLSGASGESSMRLGPASPQARPATMVILRDRRRLSLGVARDPEFIERARQTPYEKSARPSPASSRRVASNPMGYQMSASSSCDRVASNPLGYPKAVAPSYEGVSSNPLGYRMPKVSSICFPTFIFGSFVPSRDSPFGSFGDAG